MKAYYIYPETIGCTSEWDKVWVEFCEKLGYKDSAPPFILVQLINIQS